MAKMNLNDLLALLPDNEVGIIDAAALRTVVTSIWEHIWIASDYPYYYRPGDVSEVGNSEVSVPDWSGAGTMIYIAQEAADGSATPRDLIDTPGTRIRVGDNVTGARFLFQVTEPVTESDGNGARILTVHGEARAVSGVPGESSNMTVVVLSEWEE